MPLESRENVTDVAPRENSSGDTERERPQDRALAERHRNAAPHKGGAPCLRTFATRQTAVPVTALAAIVAGTDRETHGAGRGTSMPDWKALAFAMKRENSEDSQ